MKNKHTISFYHPKACLAETSATRFTTTQRSRSHEHAHTTGSEDISTKNREFAMSTPPLYIILIIHIH